MKIKVAATSLESAGIRSSRAAATVARTAFIIVLLAVDNMFAVKLAAAQQVAFKAGRAPRIYNALITSDQRLLPSQADPIIAPVFRPFPFYYNGWPEVYTAEVPSPASSRLAQQQAVGVAAAASAVVPEVSAATPEAVGSARARDDGSEPASVAVVKNNKPADTSVPDVPPPPLPVSRAGAATGKKKKPEEFPPPPVSFAI